MRHHLPAYSQFLDVKNKSWQRRSCGIVALKMVLEYWKTPNTTIPSLSHLIQEGHECGAYIKNIGWKHKGLVDLGKKYGLRGKNYDWAKKKPHEALQKLIHLVTQYPIIASVYRTLIPGTHGNLVVITKITKTHVWYHDPDSHTRKGVRKKTTIKKFTQGWKQRIVLLYSKRKG